VWRPKKSLGQNFLRDENILRKIVESLNLRNGDVVLEIGPGQGALTKHLAGEPVKLIGVELDTRAVELLRQTLGDGMDLIQADVLDVKLEDISAEHEKKIRVVGNIPYYLTSKILFWVLDASSVVSDATLMVQLDVARRLVAAPNSKEYGVLSVLTQFFSVCEILFKVSRNCFYPRPEVDSAVVRLRIREELPPCNEKFFRAVVRGTFGKRRKTLKNGLRSMGFSDSELGRVSFDLTKRPEELGVEEFLNLTKSLSEALDRE
jgi:16S rRNA (adenine1518-N6/adenine1519-N6)-dimethyltransferase